MAAKGGSALWCRGALAAKSASSRGQGRVREAVASLDDQRGWELLEENVGLPTLDVAKRVDLAAAEYDGGVLRVQHPVGPGGQWPTWRRRHVVAAASGAARHSSRHT